MTLFKNKLRYAFILGHVPLLSAAEIFKVLEQGKVEAKEIVFKEQFLIIEAGSALDCPALQNRLGGTIKIVKIEGILNSKEKLLPFIQGWLKQRLTKHNQAIKFQFGFSLYGEAIKNLTNLGLTLKKDFKKAGFISRFVVSKSDQLSAVIVTKEHLLEQGADLSIINDGGEIYVGPTVSVQEFAEYSQRDYGRPARDDKSGMLPPKLAKMMLNLAQAESTDIILDPFCGSGTILQEALLLGFQNLIGSDISAKAIADTQKNLAWLKARSHFKNIRVEVLEADVAKIAAKVGSNAINDIVTEPYLGPVAQISREQLAAVLSELTALYLKAFEQFHKILKSGGKVVIIFPIILGQTLNILEDIKKIGFALQSLGDNFRGSITYQREGQRVLREIFIFKKV